MNGNIEGTNKFLIPGSVVLAGILIAGAVMWNNIHPAAPVAQGQQAGQQAAAAAADISKVKIAGEPYIGAPNAPVVIAFWSDFQCPYCKAFETGGIPQITTPAALPDIIKNYVATGKAKVVFKDFAFLGQDSITDGEYARAMWKLYPDKYFDWRTAMYTAQDAEGDQGFGDAASVDQLNTTISGIDAAKVAADVVANKTAYDAAMNADRAEAQTQGVSATPSFVIGKRMIPGAQPYAAFQAAIDAVLK
jgi:protein-disulfide isomerase